MLRLSRPDPLQFRFWDPLIPIRMHADGARFPHGVIIAYEYVCLSGVKPSLNPTQGVDLWALSGAGTAGRVQGSCLPLGPPWMCGLLPPYTPLTAQSLLVADERLCVAKLGPSQAFYPKYREINKESCTDRHPKRDPCELRSTGRLVSDAQRRSRVPTRPNPTQYP